MTLKTQRVFQSDSIESRDHFDREIVYRCQKYRGLVLACVEYPEKCVSMICQTDLRIVG